MAIKTGSKVTIHYTIKAEGKTVISSKAKDPVIFECGKGEMIPGVEKGLTGLNIGDKKTITVPPEEGFGERMDDAIQKVPKEAFDNAEEIKAGTIIDLKGEEQDLQAIVTEVSDKEITLDMNHPLAGKSLEFEVEVLKVE